ncbi:GCN5-related N-acetyltransferase 6, chloroplastic isoform X1 [Daucus carota subsp. sativus]|uniref:GCN5-related N-acetyltransferase 6, chloroplastic isoform X1 n=1 Tax=Daucus carota subsp. sativus TaxID=79200 RepID=UPI0030834338
MISTIIGNRPAVLISYSRRLKNDQRFYKASASWTMTMDSKPLQKGNKENISSDIPKGLISSPETSKTSLQFNRLQPPKEACREDSRLDFGQFTAREAVLDEEYWTAAWLRAESHWEDKASDRNSIQSKEIANRRLATSPHAFWRYNFLQMLETWNMFSFLPLYDYISYFGSEYTWIHNSVPVKNEPRNVILKNVVGTLDLSMRRLLHGETFPAERVKIPLFCSIQKEGSKYGYISNLCVAKSARRQGIASNMLSFAIKSAIYYGAEQVFVHVHRNNKPAQLLYQKMGFEVVEIASSQLSAEQTYLLCLRAQGLEEKYL